MIWVRLVLSLIVASVMPAWCAIVAGPATAFVVFMPTVVGIALTTLTWDTICENKTKAMHQVQGQREA